MLRSRNRWLVLEKWDGMEGKKGDDVINTL